MTVRVITGGLRTTVQDLGRMGQQRHGVPVGGAMDRMALRIGNMLVGNDEGDASLEATLIGPALAFERDTVVCVTGGDLDAAVDGTSLPMWRAARLTAGSTLRFGPPRLGCHAYVAVAGGIDVPAVFGSRGTYLRAHFGGVDGRALRAGDVLGIGTAGDRHHAVDRSLGGRGGPGGRTTVSSWTISASLRPRYSEEPVVRVIAGAHTELLTAAARAALTDSTFRVSSSSDRMGYRLDGPRLALRQPVELLSEGVAFGTIQLPPGGTPIVLMADRQTTGGYPRVGEVASVDLPLVAQLKPADRLRFRFISLEEAQRLYLQQEQELAQARVGMALRVSRGSP